MALVSTVFVAAITKDGPTIRSLSAHLATVLSVFVLFHLVACLVFPELTRHEFTGRWEGLTGNPNTFGPLCTFSVILSLIAVTQKVGNTLKWILLLSVPAAVFALIKTSSVSSIGLLIVGLAFLLVLSTTKNTSTMMRSVVVTSLISLVTLALSTAALVYPEILTAKGFLASIGRDTTLTGRIDLWHVAADLISRKFWFGWSIDSATSVNEILKYEHSIQFHNGYLDLMVRGGAIGTFVAFLLASFNLLKCVRKLKESYALFSSLFVLQLLVLLHNITEASLFRETHQLWLWYTTFIYFGSAYNLGSLRKNTGHD